MILCVGLAVVAYRALPDIVPDRRLQSALAQHAEDWTGGELHLQRDAVISLNRGLQVTLGDAVLAGSTGGVAWRIEVPSLSASLRPWPLLQGRVEIERLVLDRPRFMIAEGDPSAADMPMMSRKLSSPAGEVILTDASIAHPGMDEIRGVDLRLTAESESPAVLLTGGFPLGERRIHLQARLEDAAEAFSKAGSHARLVLSAADPEERPGTMPPRPQSDVAGAVADSQVMRVLRRAAVAIGLPGTGPVNIEGRFAVAPRSLEIADAAMSVGGVFIDGDLSATLTGDAPPLAQLDAVARGAKRAWRDAAAAIGRGAWRQAPVAIDWLAPLDIVLSARMRQDTLGGPDLEARRIRLETRGADARFDVSLAGDLGRLTAGTTLGPDPARGDAALRIGTRGRLEDVDIDGVARYVLAHAPPHLVSPPQLPSGMLGAEFDLVTLGGTLGEMLATLDGSLEARAADGRLVGADLVLTLESVAQGRDFMTEQDGPLIPAAGVTAYDTIEGRIDLAAGRARLFGARIAGERYAIDMLGAADLVVGELKAEGNATLYGDDTEDATAGPLVDLPFGVGGTLTAPVVAAGVPTREAAAEPASADGVSE